MVALFCLIERSLMSYLNEVLRWFSSVEGKYIDTGAKSHPECVDLTRHYGMHVHRAPEDAYGHGKDVAREMSKLRGWSFVGPASKAEPGDIASWDWDDYGHTAVVVRDLGDRLEVIQQNPKAAHKAIVTKRGLLGYARPPRKTTPKSSDSHTVSKGDTFWSVAKANGMSVNQLRALNPGIDPDNLPVGSTLVLSKKTHTVVKGETLSSIARKYGTTLDALKKANPRIDPNVIVVGQSIKLP